MGAKTLPAKYSMTLAALSDIHVGCLGSMRMAPAVIGHPDSLTAEGTMFQSAAHKVRPLPSAALAASAMKRTFLSQPFPYNIVGVDHMQLRPLGYVDHHTLLPGRV